MDQNTSENIELPVHLRINPFAPKTPPQPSTATRPITRRGKIARLPRPIRETLNRRLADGEVGHKLLSWLNAQPDVRAVLAGEFEGRAITEQNLSEWRQGGYVDWEQKEFLRDSLQNLVEELDELEDGENQTSLADRCATLQALALSRLLTEALAEPVSEQREKRILALVRALNTVRRSDHELQRVRLQREKQEQAQAEKAPLDEDQIRERVRLEAFKRKLTWQEFDQLDTEREEARKRKLSGHR